MRVWLGQIAEVADPKKLGRAKLIIPATGRTTPSGWAWRLQLPGVFFGPSVGDNVLVIAIPSRPNFTLFWLGPLDKAPDGQTTTPRAEDYSIEDLPGLKVMDFGFAEILADHTGDQLIISTRPPGNPARITLDANVPQITISPGGADVIFDQAGQRLAMVGDQVVVQSPDGPLSGRITSGSVPAQAPFFF